MYLRREGEDVNESGTESEEYHHIPDLQIPESFATRYRVWMTSLAGLLCQCARSLQTVSSFDQLGQIL